MNKNENQLTPGFAKKQTRIGDDWEKIDASKELQQSNVPHTGALLQTVQGLIQVNSFARLQGKSNPLRNLNKNVAGWLAIQEGTFNIHLVNF
jgi:hypothetical protein